MVPILENGAEGRGLADDFEQRVIALAAAPAGCAFLAVAEHSGLPPSVLARPAVAVHATAVGQSQLSPWISGHEWLIAAVLAEGPRLLPLARTILSQPGAAWMFAPLDRNAQEWLGPVDEAPTPDRLVTPSGPPTEFERYAHKPERRFVTTTAVDGTSSLLAAFAHGVNDYDDEPPFARYRLRVSTDVRVFEVDGAAAWRRLCLRYPAEGEDGRIVPHWSEVARDWDAVHLSLGGLLVAEQVRIDGPEGWTEHWAWETEQTVWLRWRFESVERLPDFADLPEPGHSHPALPAEMTSLHWPWRLHAPPDGVSSIRPEPHIEEHQRGDAAPSWSWYPEIRLRLSGGATVYGDSATRIVADFDRIISRDGGDPDRPRAIAWPRPLPAEHRVVKLILGAAILPIRLQIRLFRTVDRHGVPQGEPHLLAWPLDRVDADCQVARLGPEGHWEVSLRLPERWSDLFVAVTADSAIPDELPSARLRRLPAEGAAWIFRFHRD